MGQITIQCRLIASPTTRQQLWQMMAELNTPLINELLLQIRDQPDFETWRRRGKLPSSVAAQLCSSLKTDPRFSGQPARFYASAAHVADYTFKSWLAIQKRLQGKIDRKSRWLEKLKSDEELQELSGRSLPELRAKATSILEQVNQPTKAKSRKAKSQNGTSQATESGDDTTSSPSLFTIFFQRYEQTEDVLEQCAIAYLLKNRCQLPEEEEDPEKFAHYRRKVEIQIEKLQEKIEARLPKGRDLTGRSWLETLATATTTVPKDNTEAKHWQDRLLADPKSFPFPILFEANEDLVWARNMKGRICVHFNGLREHTFQVYCDKRHLHWFQRFLEDQETKRASKNQHSSALFTLRASKLAWTEGEGKGAPWEQNYLTLFCTVDTRLWSIEGTEQVRQEKAVEVAPKTNPDAG